MGNQTKYNNFNKCKMFDDEYIRLLFKRLPFDYVVDYVIVAMKVKLHNDINKMYDERFGKMPKM